MRFTEYFSFVNIGLSCSHLFVNNSLDDDMWYAQFIIVFCKVCKVLVPLANMALVIYEKFQRWLVFINAR